MLLTGQQSMGKSTFMKVLCFCEWVEKKIITGDGRVKAFYSNHNRFRKDLSAFFRLGDTYFDEQSEIHYEGDAISIDLERGASNVKITKAADFDSKSTNSKLCFIPAERNLVYAMKDAGKAYSSNSYDMLFNYLIEYTEVDGSHYFSKDEPLSMPFDEDVKFYYDEDRKSSIVDIGRERFLHPMFTSSGIQSSLPMLLMVKGILRQVGSLKKTTPSEITNMLTRILMEKDKKGGTDRTEILNIASKSLIYSKAHLFVEEPEENLFPESQFKLVLEMVKSIKETNSRMKTNSYLTLTTHSPYILSTFNLLLKAASTKEIAPAKTEDIVNDMYLLPINQFAAYSFERGTMRNILDKVTGFISGDYLDSISEKINDCSNRLNDIIYGDFR